MAKDYMVKQPLHVEAQIQTAPVCLSQPCWVEVRLTNQHTKPVLINRRLAVGYRNRLDRELFADVFRRGDSQVVSKEARLYQRDYASPQDYVWLQPGQTASTRFDLFKWYTLQSLGDYDLVVCYQADTTLASAPEGLLTGIYCSERIPFTVVAAR